MNQLLQSKYPGLIQSIEAAKQFEPINNNAAFAPDYMEVYFDGQLALQWVKNTITKSVQYDLSYSPELIELYIDGRLALVLFGRDLVFSRFKDGATIPFTPGGNA